MRTFSCYMPSAEKSYVGRPDIINIHLAFLYGPCGAMYTFNSAGETRLRTLHKTQVATKARHNRPFFCFLHNLTPNAFRKYSEY